MEVELSTVDEIIDQHGLTERALIPTLLGIQEKYHYLPPEALNRVVERMSVPAIQVHQVAEFYKALSLEARGRHIATVCLGTACHVQGGGRLIDHAARTLEVEPGNTTEDMQFTLEGVNCLGCCNLAPVMTVDGKYYGNMVASKVEKVLDQYRDQEVAVHE
ncbi:MAG: NAD(P)H-dependent oxidoreductase subunit E [Anaerolineales bacterium]|nr:NAD(P)H-dependent oxidoreductase subunit E [Anaerolineales bacterium]